MKDSAQPLLLPDFFLAGAPKCGTSSLFYWLSSHPQLRGASPKEPFFFMDKEHPLLNSKNNYHRSGLAGWAKHFEDKKVAAGAGVDVSSKAPLYFEATTHLIYQQMALDVLPAVASRPRFVFLLRDPVERLRSSFMYTRENLGRVSEGLSLESYAQLLLAGRQEELNDYVHHAGSSFVLQRDLQYGEYWRYLSHWRKVLSPDRMLVLQLESLRQRPREVLTEVFEFLQVPSQAIVEQIELTRRNETQAVRHRAVQRWARKAAVHFPEGSARQLVRHAYERLQRFRQVSTSTWSPEMRARLRAHYNSDQQQLAEHFPIDLDLWNG